MLAISAASAYCSGMICSSSIATSTSTSRMMSSSRAMLEAESVMMSTPVSRLAMSVPLDEMSGRSSVPRSFTGAKRIGHDLRDDLVTGARGIRGGAHDGGHRPLARALDRHDLVEVAGAHGGDPVHLEDRQQDAEDVLLGDPPRRLHGDLLARHARSQHVVEAHDLAGGVDDRLDVGVVEVEHDEPAALGRRDRRRRRRRGGQGRRRRRRDGRAAARPARGSARGPTETEVGGAGARRRPSSRPWAAGIGGTAGVEWLARSSRERRSRSRRRAAGPRRCCALHHCCGASVGAPCGRRRKRFGGSGRRPGPRAASPGGTT